MGIKYARIINDGADIELAPDEFEENGMKICGFTPDFMLARGWYLVIYSTPADEEHEYKASYTLVNNQIIQNWTVVE